MFVCVYLVFVCVEFCFILCYVTHHLPNVLLGGLVEGWLVGRGTLISSAVVGECDFTRHGGIMCP